jgi:hypothetical protein
MDRTSRVLVGYATAGGSTQSIAERIADVLRDAGLTVVCRPVGPGLEPGAFDAVVVGSAVHGMAWLRPAVEILSRLPAGEAPSCGASASGGCRTRSAPGSPGGWPAASCGRSSSAFQEAVDLGTTGSSRESSTSAVEAWATEIAIRVDAPRAPADSDRV